MKKTLILALAFMTTGAFAQTTSTATTTEAKAKEKSPFSLRLIDQIGTQISEGKNAGFTNDLYITPGYKINDKYSMNFDNMMRTAYSRSSEEATNQYYYSTLNLYRSGILSQKEHGINLSANARVRAYVHAAVNNIGSTPGYGRVGMTASRSLTDSLSATLSTQYAVYARDNAKASTSSSYLYPYFILSYSANDKLSFGATLEYIRIFKKGTGEMVTDKKGKTSKVYDVESLDLTLEAGYQFTPKFNLSASVGSNLMTSHDKVDQLDNFADLAKNFNYAVTGVFSVF